MRVGAAGAAIRARHAAGARRTANVRGSGGVERPAAPPPPSPGAGSSRDAAEVLSAGVPYSAARRPPSFYLSPSA